MSEVHAGTFDPDETLCIDEAHAGVHLHVTQFWTMLWVLIILLVLTALTVWTSRMHEIVVGHTVIDFGTTPHIVMALVIAVIKGTLVAAYFMHLKYDKPINIVVVGATIFGVVLFMGLTLADLSQRSIIDPSEYNTIVQGGDSHLPRGSNERSKGVGVVRAAREAAPQAHGEAPADDHAQEEPSADSHSEPQSPADH